MEGGERPLRLALLGTGLLGASVGLAARMRAHAHVTGFDPDPEAREMALRRGAIDEAVGSVAALAGADVAVVAAPVHSLEQSVRAALEACPGAVVTDLGSTKLALAEAGFGERYIGGHPLAGAEVAGAAHAREDLFDGATWYLTPAQESSGVLLERLHRLIRSFGAVPTVIGAADHDRLMATFSHVPHVIANVMAEHAAATIAGDAIPVVGPSFRDATRVAGANPVLWGGIYESNRDAVVAGLDAVIERLTQARELLADGDREQLAAFQQRAAEQRQSLLDVGMSGGAQRELHVVVPNRPGVVADLALTLGRAGINIQDMALRPRADMQAGEVTLWVSADRYEQACELVGALIGAEATLPDTDPR